MSGHIIKCENCGVTATKEDSLPKGWFNVLDYLGDGKLFCCPDCIYHYLGTKIHGKSGWGSVRKDKTW